jgi:DNA mismatch repair ATPase MutL
MRQPLIVMTLLGALAVVGGAEAQTAKDALDKVKAADKAPPEKTKSEKDKAKAEKAAKEKAEKEAKEKAEKEAKEKAEKEKDKADKKAEKEKAKAAKEAKEKAEKEAKEKAEKEAKEKAEKEAKAKDAGAPKDASVAKEEEDDDKVEAELEELRKTRGDRKKASIEKIKTRWGVLLENPSSKDELAKHAKRMAQLQRIRALAEAKKKVKVVAKVDELITKEELRHGKAMNKLRDAAGGAK